MHFLICLRERSHFADEIVADLLAQRALVNQHLLGFERFLELAVLARKNNRDQAEADTGDPNDEQEYELPGPHRLTS